MPILEPQFYSKIKEHFSAMKEHSSKFIPKKTKIPLASPPYGSEEVIESLESLLSMETTMGSKVKKFETLFSKFIDSKYSVMVNSGSSANLLALSVLSNPSLNNPIKGGDEIITPALTWATTVYPIVNIGAKPILVDVDIDTYNIDPSQIKEAITKKTKAIMVVHLLGYPCDIKAIKKIADKNGLYLIEDCCEAHAATYAGKKVGTFGDMATFSFFASHHITTMEGGMVVTNNPEFYDIAKSMRAFGWIREHRFNKKISKKYPAIDPRFLFIHSGYNMRPTEIQGAFGIHQIKKLNNLIKIRIETARYWNKVLKPYSKFIKLPPQNKKYKHVYFVYPLMVQKNKFFTKNELVLCLEKNGIETRSVMAGNIMRQPVSKLLKLKTRSKLTNSDYIMKNSFVIGNHHGIDKKRREFVAKVITDFLKNKMK